MIIQDDENSIQWAFFFLSILFFSSLELNGMKWSEWEKKILWRCSKRKKSFGCKFSKTKKKLPGNTPLYTRILLAQVFSLKQKVSKKEMTVKWTINQYIESEKNAHLNNNKNDDDDDDDDNSQVVCFMLYNKHLAGALNNKCVLFFFVLKISDK